MRVATLVPTLSVLLCATQAAAQLSSLQPGDRIRLRLESRQEVTGELVSATADSLTLLIHPQATPTTMPIAALRGLEVSRGKPSVWSSALNTAVFGAGVIWSQFALGEGVDGGELGKHAGWGAMLGAAIGLTSGVLFLEERWSPLSLPHSLVDLAEALRFPEFAIAGR